VQQLVQFRLAHPVLQRRRFFRGAKLWDSSLKDLAWFRPDGTEMTEADWQKPFARSVAFLVAGDQIETPEVDWGKAWEVVLDTSGHKAEKRELVAARDSVPVEARSLVVLLRRLEP